MVSPAGLSSREATFGILPSLTLNDPLPGMRGRLNRLVSFERVLATIGTLDRLERLDRVGLWGSTGGLLG